MSKADCGCNSPVREGWFVNRQGITFAVIGSSLYEVETDDVKLTPGWYSDDQMQAAIAAKRKSERRVLSQQMKIARERANVLLKQSWDESQHPRDESGKFTSGGGGGGGAAASPSPPAPATAKHPGEGYSKEAYVDSKGTIHTGNVSDAQRALHEGKKVSLDQPRTLSTLIDSLGDYAKQVKEATGQEPNLDLCNVSVKGTNLFCEQSKDIPRAEMPQIPPGKEGEFLQYLKDQGHGVESTTERASYLRATQNQLDGGKISGMMKWIQKDDPQREIVISKDNYVLDGHHFWAAKVGVEASNNTLTAGTKMNVNRVDISITDLLDAANTFTGGAGKIGAFQHRPTDVRALWSNVFDIELVNRIFRQ